MPLTIEEAAVEVYDQAQPQPDAAPRSAPPPPDMDRLLRELRRTQSRLERLWAD